MVYGFYTQLMRAKPDEEALDAHFRQWYHVEKPPLEVERAHDIDRLFIRPDGSQVTVEYKIDYMSQTTGNLVVELLSSDVDNIPGWAYATDAEYIAFYRKAMGEVIVVRTAMLRLQLRSWEAAYRRIRIPNPTYNTVGLIVPVWEFKRLAEWEGLI